MKLLSACLSWSFDFKVVVVGAGRWADPDGREHCSLSISLSLSLGILLHFLAHSHTSFFQYVNVAYTSIFFLPRSRIYYSVKKDSKNPSISTRAVVVARRPHCKSAKRRRMFDLPNDDRCHHLPWAWRVEEWGGWILPRHWQRQVCWRRGGWRLGDMVSR